MADGKMNVKVAENGPYLINGDIIVTLPDGTKEAKSGVTALCRCGGSSHKPFCDGTHTNNNFKG